MPQRRHDNVTIETMLQKLQGCLRVAAHGMEGYPSCSIACTSCHSPIFRSPLSAQSRIARPDYSTSSSWRSTFSIRSSRRSMRRESEAYCAYKLPTCSSRWPSRILTSLISSRRPSTAVRTCRKFSRMRSSMSTILSLSLQNLSRRTVAFKFDIPTCSKLSNGFLPPPPAARRLDCETITDLGLALHFARQHFAVQTIDASLTFATSGQAPRPMGTPLGQ
jgi:hypothetical protein